MKIKIGPITASYKGTVKIQEADEADHTVAMRAQAKDARGQGTAAATITSTMEEVADGTKITVVTDMRVTGPAAQFGRGVMQDVSAKLMTRFADCLAEQMQTSPDVETTTGGRAASAEAEAPRRRPRRAAGRRSRQATPGASSGVSSADGRAAAAERVVGHLDGRAQAGRRAAPDRRRARPRRGEPRRGPQARWRRSPPASVALLILFRIIRR